MKLMARTIVWAAAVLIGATAMPYPDMAFGESHEARPPARYVLDNDMEIVVIPDRRAPVVTHMIWYKVGSADETPGMSGIAHFLEHLMFKGTTNAPAGEFSARVAAIGGKENAFTAADYTAYYQKVAPDALGMVMSYEADRMANLVVDEKDIEAEREVVLQERRQRVDTRPGGILSEAMGAALYLNHPYGIPIIGWEHELASLTVRDATDFYQRHYGPNNAVLIVAGDVDPANVLELARETYGKIERRGDPSKRVRPREPEPRSERRVYYSDARVTAPSFRRIYLAPSYRLAKPREAEALDLLAAILGGLSTSRIKRELLVDNQMAASAGASYWGGFYDMSEFSIHATPLPGQELEAVEKRIDAIIARIVEEGVTGDELEAAKSSLIKSALFDRDSQTSMARTYGTVLVTDGTIEDVVRWPERIRAVTIEDVNAAARKYLKKNRAVSGYLLKDAS